MTTCASRHKTPLDASSGVGFVRRLQPQFINKTRPYKRLGFEPKYFDYQSNACTNSATLAKSETNCCNGLECRAKELLCVISPTAWVVLSTPPQSALSKCMLTLEPVRVIETLSEVYKAPALPLCYTGITRLFYTLLCI